MIILHEYSSRCAPAQPMLLPRPVATDKIHAERLVCMCVRSHLHASEYGWLISWGHTCVSSPRLPMFSSTLEWSSSLCLLGVDTHEPIAFHCKIAHFSLPREINSKPVFGERFTRLRLGGVVKKQFPQEWQPLHAECLRSTLQG